MTAKHRSARKVARDNFILWVVEMYLKDGDGWQPTIGVKFSREEGRAVLNDWRKRNPDDKFRLVTYGKLRP